MKEKLLNELKNSLQLLELIEMAKAEKKSLVNELYEFSLLTGLKDGKIATRAKAMLVNIVLPQAINNLLTSPEEVCPELAEEKSAKMQKALQEYREFMNEVQHHPNESTVSHYLNLKWSNSRGNRVKAELVAQGFLEPQTIKAGQGRPREVLKPTEKAKELFGL